MSYFARLAERMIGKGGVYLCGSGDLQEVYCGVLLGGYYRCHDWIGHKMVRKICNGTEYPSRSVVRWYTGADGYDRTLADMQALTDAYYGISVLWMVQEEIHRWICTWVQAEDLDRLAMHYVADGADKAQIAVYLADVMQYVVRCCPPQRIGGLRK